MKHVLQMSPYCWTVVKCTDWYIDTTSEMTRLSVEVHVFTCVFVIVTLSLSEEENDGIWLMNWPLTSLADHSLSLCPLLSASMFGTWMFEDTTEASGGSSERGIMCWWWPCRSPRTRKYSWGGVTCDVQRPGVGGGFWGGLLRLAGGLDDVVLVRCILWLQLHLVCTVLCSGSSWIHSQCVKAGTCWFYMNCLTFSAPLNLLLLSFFAHRTFLLLHREKGKMWNGFIQFVTGSPRSQTDLQRR